MKNGIYTGSSADGSDMRRVEGMYVSSCGNFWGNKPFTKASEKAMRRMAWKETIKQLRKGK